MRISNTCGGETLERLSPRICRDQNPADYGVLVELLEKKRWGNQLCSGLLRFEEPVQKQLLVQTGDGKGSMHRLCFDFRISSADIDIEVLLGGKSLRQCRKRQNMRRRLWKDKNQLSLKSKGRIYVREVQPDHDCHADQCSADLFLHQCHGTQYCQSGPYYVDQPILWRCQRYLLQVPL